MPIDRKYFADFEENGFYHVYNRTNNKERLFRTQENYRFFLLKYEKYLSLYTDTFSWCLLPNHFHFFIRVKPSQLIRTRLEAVALPDLTKFEKRYLENSCSLSELIESVFKRFFQSYALAFNKIFKRKGNLFYKSFKRIRLESDADFIRTLIYIHRNPLKHNFITDFTKYQWSSWKNYILREKSTFICYDILNLFCSHEDFITSHHRFGNTTGKEFFLED